jgi:hypothetical protein
MPLHTQPFVEGPGVNRTVPAYAIDELTHLMLQHADKFLHLSYSQKYNVPVPLAYREVSVPFASSKSADTLTVYVTCCVVFRCTALRSGLWPILECARTASHSRSVNPVQSSQPLSVALGCVGLDLFVVCWCAGTLSFNTLTGESVSKLVAVLFATISVFVC